MTTEDRIASHYTTGALSERIGEALAMLDIGPDRVRPEDLKPVDEFHTGGLEATEALLDQLAVTPATRVLDIGSGIGGTARFLAVRHGCKVAGIDLTPEFVETARALTALVGLDGKIEFREGSALDIPHEDGSFDLALLLHVGMNIEDKQRLMAEAHRVLCPGGHFAVFEVMEGPAPAPLRFPLPWSSVPETSFVAPPNAYAEAAEGAGFQTLTTRDRSDFAKAFFDKVFARIAAEGAPPLGIHLLMGETAREKIANYVENLNAGRIAPTEMIFRKPGEG